MSSLKARIKRIETGLDVSGLSREQTQMLDVFRLTREQRAALDGSHLTCEQVDLIGFENLTDEQLTSFIKYLDEQYPKTQAVIHTMSDEELRATKEGRLSLWYPGCTPDLNE